MATPRRPIPPNPHPNAWTRHDSLRIFEFVFSCFGAFSPAATVFCAATRCQFRRGPCSRRLFVRSAVLGCFGRHGGGAGARPRHHRRGLLQHRARLAGRCRPRREPCRLERDALAGGSAFAQRRPLGRRHTGRPGQALDLPRGLRRRAHVVGRWSVGLLRVDAQRRSQSSLGQGRAPSVADPLGWDGGCSP